MTAHDVCFSVHAVKGLFSETHYGEGKSEKTSFKCQVMLLIPKAKIWLRLGGNQTPIYIF